MILLSFSHVINRCHRLQKEICDFFAYVKPREFEETARLDLVTRVQSTIRAWGGVGDHARTCDVHCFGSFASRLYLPTADMDLVVLSKSFQSGGPRLIGQSMNQLRGLVQHIENMGIAKHHTTSFIGKSKVPLVKFTDKRTGLKVDISFENDSGFPALRTFEAWKVQYPALPTLVALVKQFLVMRGINEVFCGGIGGFTTICLVMHILQTMPEIQSGNMDPEQHYGEIFMKFLDFYGNKIDIRSTGILMEAPYHYDKDKSPRTMQNKERLTIIDPNNKDNDISGGSHKIDTVFGRFRTAYTELQRYMDQLHMGQISSTSILECIIGGNYQQVDAQRERLRHLYGAMAPSSAPQLAPAPTIPSSVKDTPAPKLAKAKKPNKKEKLRQQKAAEAQGQYAPPAQTPAPTVSSAPKYVAPMANAPWLSRNGGEYGNIHSPALHHPHSYYPIHNPIPIHCPQTPSVPTHFTPNHGYNPYNLDRAPYSAEHEYVPPPPSGTPPPSSRASPPPPPPDAREQQSPSSPGSSVSMDMSD
jgi:DNA polymerase sigma